MDTYALEQMIIKEKELGNHPFFVNCMAGSTVIGSFDKQNDIADIAKLKLDDEQVAEAEQLAAQCISSSYSDCPE